MAISSPRVKTRVSGGAVLAERGPGQKVEPGLRKSRFRISCRTRIRPRPSASARRGCGRSPPGRKRRGVRAPHPPRARSPVPPNPSTGGCRVRPRSRAGVRRASSGGLQARAAGREVCHGGVLRVVPGRSGRSSGHMPILSRATGACLDLDQHPSTPQNAQTPFRSVLHAADSGATSTETTGQGQAET
jgi:hypothetical protein